MARLTEIDYKTKINYQHEIQRLQGEIAEVKEKLKRTWLNFIEHISNYVLNYKKYEEKQQEITDLNFELFLKQQRLAEAEICHDIFQFNENNSNQILNPLYEWENSNSNSNMPYDIKNQITNYTTKYETYPFFLNFLIYTTGITKIDPDRRRGGNKKTNSKKYRKYRRKSHKKSHRKYNK